MLDASRSLPLPPPPGSLRSPPSPQGGGLPACFIVAWFPFAHGPYRRLPAAGPPRGRRLSGARGRGLGLRPDTLHRCHGSLHRSRPSARVARWPPRGRAVRRDARLGLRHAWSLPRPPKRLAVSKNAPSRGGRSREAGRMAVPLNYIYVAQRPRPAGVLLPRGGSDSICAALARQGPGFHGLGPNRTPSCGQPSAVLPPRASGS